MSKCVKETNFKYRIRRTPRYSANKCKSKKKIGNDGSLYKSVSNKKGVYRWIKVNKNYNVRKRISLKSLKNMAFRYKITTSGTKKQIAQRLINLRGKYLKVKDRKQLNNIL